MRVFARVFALCQRQEGIVSQEEVEGEQQPVKVLLAHSRCRLGKLALRYFRKVARDVEKCASSNEM